MKKLLITISALLIFSIAKAQNVGIGTTLPKEKLHVEGNVLLPVGQSLFVGGRTDLNQIGSRFHNIGNSTYIDNKGTGNIFFRADNTDGSTVRMVITGSTGNVGIGSNVAPVEKLDVDGNIKLSGRIIQEAVIAPTLSVAWQNAGVSFETAGFYKGKDGRVYLQGTVKRNGAGLTVFFLPTGYLPAKELRFAVPAGASGNAFATIFIDDSGNVVAMNVPIGEQVSLDGISFRVD